MHIAATLPHGASESSYNRMNKAVVFSTGRWLAPKQAEV